jgi:hypothetical protein
MRKCLMWQAVLFFAIASFAFAQHPSNLAGTWEISGPQGSFQLILQPDGKGFFNGKEMRWAFNQGTLALVGPSGELVYKATVTGETLTLTGGGLTAPAVWRRARAGTGSPGRPGGGGLAGIGGQPGASGPPGPIGTWEAPGPQGVISMIFKADGTGTFNGEPGTWTYKDGVLSISGASGSAFTYQASVTATTLTISGANLQAPMTFERVGEAASGPGEQAEVVAGVGTERAGGAAAPIGTWEAEGKSGPVRLDLRSDGTGVFAEENVRWQFNNGTLSIARENGTTYMYNATMDADSLTLNSAGLGRPVTFRRVGTAPSHDDLLGTAVPGAAPGAAQLGGAPQSAGRLVGKWQGKAGTVEITPDGKFIFPGSGVAPYTIEGDVLTLQATDGLLKFKVSLQGDSLVLTAADGRTLQFTRVPSGTH